MATEIKFLDAINCVLVLQSVRNYAILHLLLSDAQDPVQDVLVEDSSRNIIIVVFSIVAGRSRPNKVHEFSISGKGARRQK